MNKNTKRKLRDDERAVSPVIGVILMVAITVVMAAVIGAFVYGYGGSMTSTATPAFTVTRLGPTNVTILLSDKGGAGEITGLVVTMPDAATGPTKTTAWEIGESDTIELVDPGERLIITGTVDGNEKVVVDVRA